MTEMTDIRDGDIFRWRYADEQPGDNAPYQRYHCKSQIAIAKDGLLMDTYWSGHSDHWWTYGEAPSKLVLTFLGNFADLEPKEPYMAEYYDASDCVDISHSNSSRGNFYVLKGAKRSEKKMREVIASKIEKEASAIRVAGWRIESLQKELAKIEDGTPLEEVYL